MLGRVDRDLQKGAAMGVRNERLNTFRRLAHSRTACYETRGPGLLQIEQRLQACFRLPAA